MNNTFKKIEQINKIITTDEFKSRNLLEMEKAYNIALEQGLVNKPKYDLLDVLQIESLFFRKKFNFKQKIRS